MTNSHKKIVKEVLANFASIIQYFWERMSRCWHNLMYSAFIVLFILVVGTSFAQLHAQSEPVITVERNPYIWHESTFQAEYIFVAGADLTANLTINYEVIPSAGGSAIPKTVTMESGEHEVRAEVSEAHTEVRLRTGMGYTFGSQETAAYVLPTTVNDGVRGLQLRFDKTSVLEGGSARLTMRATPPVDSEARVGERPTNTIVFPSWPTEYYATSYEIVETSIDGVGVAYTTRTINFANNSDMGDSATVTLTPEISGPWIYDHATTTIQLIDDDGNSQVSIESNKAVITEGESIELTISALPLLTANSPLTVNYTHNNSVYTNNIGTSIDLTDTENSKKITVTTHDRTQTDGDGEIVVTLSDGGSNYDLVSNKSVVRIKVIDKQTPRPRISTNSNNVNVVDEGLPVELLLKLNLMLRYQQVD